MPIFGEYETVGEPVAVTEARDHVSTIWRVRKGGSQGDPLHALKCFAPRRRQTSAGQTADSLDADGGLEFLEAVKQLKKAQSEGGRCLSPIHAFGTSDEGVWYVTDYYQRGNLKTWIARRGGVDDDALRNVVYSVVLGCLALKRSCGRSHGNLKAGNVFLAGKPRPLRKTPLLVVDPIPASAFSTSHLEAEDRRTIGGLIHDVFEAQDLRAIGELILQLVEGRLIESGYDYNYPIVHSPAWRNLGKHGEFWRELCNRLLDPQLSLGKVNLEKLEKEFRPNPVVTNMPALFAVAGVACLAAGLLYLVFKEWTPKLTQQPSDATSETGSSTNFAVAAKGGKLRYQWWKDVSAIPGETNSILSIIAVQTNNIGRYYVVITNRVGAITSEVARLTVVELRPVLTVKPDDKRRTYGTANPPLSGSITLNGDSITATFGSTAVVNSPVGGYDIFPIFSDPNNKLRNYTVITNKGTLTIAPAELTVTANSTSRAAGTANPFFTGSITPNADSITVTFSTVAGIGSPAGKYDIVPTLNDPERKLNNYTVITNIGALTVIEPTAKQVLTVTADSKSRPYRSANPVLTGSITPNIDSITATFDTKAEIGSLVGRYDIVPVLKDPNRKFGGYTVITNTGTLTIVPVNLTVTTKAETRAYGLPNPPLTGTITTNSDSITTAFSTAAETDSPVGEYEIKAMLTDPNGRLGNYVVVTNKGTLTITRAALTITAKDQRRGQGETNPPLTGTIVGLRPGDAITSTYKTTAVTNSPADEYEIIPQVLGASNLLRNYIVAVNNGKLVVEKQTPPVVTTKVRPPVNNLFGVDGFDFVWVPNLRGKGAWVQKTELSQSQYQRLSGGPLPEGQLNATGTNYPVKLGFDPQNVSNDHVTILLKALKNRPLPPELTNGHFELPTREDFRTYARLRELGAEDENPNFASMTNILLRAGANTGQGKISTDPNRRPVNVTEGKTNEYGLLNVFGNAWEWCDDRNEAGRSCAGYAYDSGFGTIFRSYSLGRGLHTTVRLLFVPE